MEDAGVNPDIFKQHSTHSASAAWIGKTIGMSVAQIYKNASCQIHYFLEILQQSSSLDWRKVKGIPYIIKVGWVEVRHQLPNKIATGNF